MEMLQGVWKPYLRLRAVVGYGVKIVLPSPPNYVTRSPGNSAKTQNTNQFKSYSPHISHSVCCERNGNRTDELEDLLGCIKLTKQHQLSAKTTKNYKLEYDILAMGHF